MTKILKKKFIFGIGLFITTFVSFVHSFISSDFSEKGSILVQPVSADVAPGFFGDGDGRGAADAGDAGDGGCSDGCY